MKLKVTRYSLQIIPETPQDEAFIEEVLKIKGNDVGSVLVRKNIFGTQKLSYIEIETLRS